MPKKMLKQVLKEVEKLKEDKPTEPVKKKFPGYKATILLKDGRQIAVRFAPFDLNEIVKSMKVKSKVGEVEVFYRSIKTSCPSCEEEAKTRPKKGWVDADGKIYDKNLVEHYQVFPDGREEPVVKFKKTKNWEVVKRIPIVDAEGWRAEGHQQVWADESGLYEGQKLAFELQKNDETLVIEFSHGNTFTKYYGIISPIVRKGKFGFVMKLARSKFIYDRLTDINAHAKKPKEKEQTVQKGLPEI